MKLIFIIVAAVLKQNLSKNCGIKSQALMGVVIKYAHLIYLNPRVVTENEILNSLTFPVFQMKMKNFP